MQALIYPVTDAGCNTASYGEFGERPRAHRRLDAALLEPLPRRRRRADPDASPLRAGDLAGSPPAFVLTAGSTRCATRARRTATRCATRGSGRVPPLRRRHPRLLAVARGRRALPPRGRRGRPPRCARGSPERTRSGPRDFGRSGQPRRRYGARHGCHTHHRHVPLLAPVRRHGGRVPARAADRARGGRLGLRRRRPPLPRRHREPLVRQHRPLQPRGRRPRGGADGAPGGLLHLRRLRQPAGQRARRAARLPRADGRRPHLPRLRRRRRDRRGGQDRPPPLDPAGPPRARAPDQPHAGLPRHARLRHEHRRHRGEHEQLGPARPAVSVGRVRLAARAGGRDRARRPRERRGVLLRAGDRRRRRATLRPRATSRASRTCAPSTGSCSWSTA